MRLTGTLFVGLLCALCAALCFGQDGKSNSDKRRPDLTGTWVLDESLAARGRSSRADASQVTLLIAHREPEIRITRKVVSGGRERTQEGVYYADGRGETNLLRPISTDADDDSKTEIKSETRWKKDKLVTKSTLRRAVGGRFLTVKMTDEWALSTDGRVLTQVTVIRTDAGDNTPGPARGGETTPLGRQVVIAVDPPEIKRAYRRVAD